MFHSRFFQNFNCQVNYQYSLLMNIDRYFKKIFQNKYKNHKKFANVYITEFCFRIPYWCARSSKWGDRLPVVLKEEKEEFE